MTRRVGGNPCANCGDNHTADEVCRIHWEARLTGHEDRQTGEPANAKQWPSGHYGHADYWIGFYGSISVRLNDGKGRLRGTAARDQGNC